MAEQESSRKLVPILSIVLQLAFLIIVLYFVLEGPPLSILMFPLIYLLLSVNQTLLKSIWSR